MKLLRLILCLVLTTAAIGQPTDDDVRAPVVRRLDLAIGALADARAKIDTLSAQLLQSQLETRTVQKEADERERISDANYQAAQQWQAAAGREAKAAAEARAARDKAEADESWWRTRCLGLALFIALQFAALIAWGVWKLKGGIIAALPI